MSNPIYIVTQPNVSANYDNATFDIQSGASLNLGGSSDMVILESGVKGVTFSGSNNTIMGTKVNNTIVTKNDWSSSQNSMILGANSDVYDYGANERITAGANSFVETWGIGTTITATQGGCEILPWMGNTINGNNDSIWLLMND